jgi:hypothetical protein
MRNLKSFLLAVAASVALTAFVGVGSASGTELTCSSSLCAAETAIEAESEGKVVLDAPFGNVECNSTVEGHTTNTEGSPDGPISGLKWTNCGVDVVTTLAAGTLSIESTGSSNGTLTSTGAKVTVEHIGTHCIFETINTTLGTLTGSNTTKSNATLDISATIPRIGGRSGIFCGSSAPWTGSYKFTTPSTLNVDGGTPPPTLEGEAPTGYVGETLTVTWRNTGGTSAVIDDEINSDGTVAETLGSGCGTIAGGGSCTSRKVKCLKAGESTLTARDTPSVEGSFKVKCDEHDLAGSPTTANVGETVTVTWKNNTEGSLVIEDETISNGTVVETLGSSCGTIAATSSCTSRKIKCLKAGESTVTAADTPSTEGKFVIKCD